ncbi:di-heme oxidoredictase family protein [Singulisphaera sp. PoT]|uniref:di-heme oxidoredictase family protein n=1 Tax=Singulisphaera sp. PoT TaxID=3411797 RepID=UPI003BF581B7
MISPRKAACLGLLGIVGLTGTGLIVTTKAPAADSKAGKVDSVALGREIFNREWLPGDGRSHGGDGLGPVYNDTSCVACHNSGGVGGGGPLSKNIDILSASGGFIPPVVEAGQAAKPGQPQRPTSDTKALYKVHAGFRAGRTVVLHKFGIDPNYQAWRKSSLTPQTQGAMPLGPGVVVFNGGVGQVVTPLGAPQQTEFASVTTTVTESVAPVPTGQVVSVPQAPQTVAPIEPPQATATVAFEGNITLNSFGTTPATAGSARAQQQLQEAFASMVSRTKGQIPAGEFVVSHSQRNATSLFGIGLLDAIPEAVIEAGAKPSKDFPETLGRVSRLKDGRVGRLGWKGQTANSEDFVLTACAVELGLEVPGHEQSISPQAPKYKAGGEDLTADECSALVAYVRSIPRPLERVGQLHEEKETITGGKALFASVGCASCHNPKLGDVDGVYSDLLLHDMGPELADNGSYNGDGDDSDPLNPVLGNDIQARANRPATKQEWRTPPLWGFRDSAPYLHDGRADTLEQAVAGHGGQGRASALRFFELSHKDRLKLEAFLKALVAPGAGGEDRAIAAKY